MNRSVLLGLIGGVFYFGFIGFDFVEFAGGGWLDTYGVYFAFLPIVSLFFLFASVSLMRLDNWREAFLNLNIAMTIIFGFPNVSFPVGGTYFEALQTDFGHLSFLMGFFTLIIWVHFYNEPKRTA